MNLLAIKRAGICCLTHLTEITDIRGHSYCHLDCEGCSDKDICLEFQRIAERRLNKYKVSTNKELFDFLALRQSSHIKG